MPNGKTALLINSLTYGGAERIVALLLKHFPACGIEPELILLERDDYYQVPEGVRVTYLSRLTGKEPAFIKLLSLPLLALRLRRHVRKNGITAVMSHVYRGNFVNALSKIFGSRQRIVMVNAGRVSRYRDEGLPGRLSLLLVRIFYPSADLLILKSEGMLADLDRLFKLAVQKRVIANPCDTEEIAAGALREPERFVFDPAFVHVVSAGRLIPLKRFDVLIRAFAELRGKRGDARLVIVGEGPERERLESLAGELGVRESVFLPGQVKNPFAFFGRADVFALSSETEGFPNVLTEAMAAGCPCVSSDCESGPREILAPGTDIARHLGPGAPYEKAPYGILTPVGDERTLSLALEDILADEGLRKGYAVSGLERVKAFALPEIMKSYADTLRPIITVSANSCWNIFNFRMGLLGAIRGAGFSVHVIVPEDSYAERVRASGYPVHVIPIQSKGTNPAADLKTLAAYRKVYRRLKPAAACHFTIKPDIYGSIAAASLGIPSVNNITGLGYAFISKSPVTMVAKALYRFSQGLAGAVFFQNPDDRELFISLRLVKPDKAFLVPGSGVDTVRFSPRDSGPSHVSQRVFTFLLIARILYDKGVAEFAEASQILKAKGLGFRALLLGDSEAQNPTAVPKTVLDGWVSEGIVEYLGKTDRVEDFIEGADCVVLPSYREGTPRTLLEAASMGKPLIATDVPGCREAIEDGVNGFLCEVKNPNSLAASMERMLGLSPAERSAMGTLSREKMLRQFDEAIVKRAYLDIIGKIINT